MHKLMIVDDSKLIRKKIERECDRGEFKVVCSAENGEQAVSMFREFSPQVVTMDLTMPNIDGIGCIKQLVQMNNEVKILVISALNDKGIGIQALEEGAMGFITKPFTETHLKTALAHILEDE